MTNLTRDAIQTKIVGEVNSYFSVNSGKFNDTIRKSKLTSQIDASDPSILGSDIDIKMSARFTPLQNPTTGNFVRTDYTINFINNIQSPLMQVPSISSDRFVVNGISCSIRNAPLHSTTLQAIDIQGNVVISNVGNYEPTTGKVNLVGFLIDSISSNIWLILLFKLSKLAFTPSIKNNNREFTTLSCYVQLRIYFLVKNTFN